MARKFRTAVLVVHGMGSQRPLETVRGIVDAVWLCPATATAPRNYWTHPELSGVDIDRGDDHESIRRRSCHRFP